ncbi:MAG: FHA domain-containing protein [Gimesia sp.]|nr:FHA domain-containing protein [Gimesia sp.]
MPTVQFSEGEQISFEGEKATIGTSSSCTIVIREDSRIAQKHAVIKKVSGRWMIESTSGAMISTTRNDLSRLCWLDSNDRIQLTAEGPELIFSATQLTPADVAVPPGNKTTKPEASPPQQSHQSAPLDSPEINESEAVVPGPGSSPQIPTEVTTPGAGAQVAPHSASPITINLSGNQPGTNHSLLWIGGGLLLVIMLMIALMVYLVVISRNSASTSQLENGNVIQGTANADRNQSTPVKPEQTVYVVFAQEQQSQIFLRLGTAVAISKNQLVTSGSVGAFIERNQDQYPIIQVHSTTDKNDIFSVKKVDLLPEYREQVDASFKLAGELRELQEEIENKKTLPTQQQLKQIGLQMGTLKDLMFQTVEKVVSLDVALLEVQDDLPAKLPLAEQLPALNKELTILGAPFIQDQTEFIPGESELETERNQGFLIRFQDLGKPSLNRMIVKSKQIDLDENWSGSVLLNAQNQIVGIYSRPAPGKDLTKPPSGEYCDVPTVIQIRKLVNPF